MITSTQNPRIVEARKLTQRKYRQRQNRFLVDGLQLLTLALQNKRIRTRHLFYCETLFVGETARHLLNSYEMAGAELLPVSESVMASLSERDTPQGLVAMFAPSEIEWTVREWLALPSVNQPNHLILVVDKLQDPGNLGTLIRTADAVGAAGVVLLEPCADPFDLKTIRGTMGSLFTMPFVRVKEPLEILPKLTNLGYRLVGADGTQGQIVWQSQAMVGSVALILGNEARGLSEELHPFLSHYVSLPLRGQAESLNVAVAGGALMYEWLRVNEK